MAMEQRDSYAFVQQLLRGVLVVNCSAATAGGGIHLAASLDSSFVENSVVSSCIAGTVGMEFVVWASVTTPDG